MRRSLLLLVSTLLFTPPSFAQEYGSPHPEAPPQLRDFEFLIGPWNCEVEWTKADGSLGRGQGTWTGRWIVDGWAIEDDFVGGFAPDYRATTFRAFNLQAGKWHGYWLDGQAGRWSRPLVEEEVDQGLRLRTSMGMRRPNGEPLELQLRYHFYEIGEKAFSWRQDTSLDDGETWTESTTRIDCERPSPTPAP